MSGSPSRPKSRYALTPGDMTLRNIIWALALTLGVVAVVAMLFFGVGREVDREVPPEQRVDVASSAQRAQDLAPFPVAVPQAGDGWTERSARYTDGEDPRWEVRYTSPDRQAVTLLQMIQAGPAVVAEALPGLRQTGTEQVAGRTCEVMAGDAQTTGYLCHGDGYDVLVTGRGQQSTLRALTEAALTSTDG
ncbi:DUF4245 domain-containing protein [Brachybacterium sp. EF45031]|uniref:DUF4245 domain-containing protein n=1 Tax=Brachybacterium sillae TaxID=2810536 RepID=UPI00217E4A3B|nr:DUF4245 domain-containing protein [Brachybacterium sillae]MCS6711172.1 DUF4245 domain-containing protein [Brachybacterium sillae]